MSMKRSKMSDIGNNRNSPDRDSQDKRSTTAKEIGRHIDRRDEIIADCRIDDVINGKRFFSNSCG